MVALRVFTYRLKLAAMQSKRANFATPRANRLGAFALQVNFARNLQARFGARMYATANNINVYAVLWRLGFLGTGSIEMAKTPKTADFA
ncbi:MAG TPA: hypothetical protein VMV59_00690 [Candidatus Dormibacteraeota bacterium]|nr:hypothetical protein [Candidatus Dormibacteraeota bacterium]